MKVNVKIRLFLLVLIVYMIKRIFTRKLPKLDTDTDILIAPGGYKGIYMMGICHYIKNHFNQKLKSKKIIGFSCGTFCALLMRIKPELDNTLLNCLFSLDKPRVSMPKFLNNVIDSLNTRLNYDDFDLSGTQIGITTSSGLKCYDQFLTLKELTHCCKCSSFVPFVTHNQLFLFYKNQLTLDGGIYYKQLKKTKSNQLIISSTMFGRYNKNLLSGFKKPKCSFYQLYLYGYHDARKNHDVLAKYFQD
jgi:hypothetical protein